MGPLNPSWKAFTPVLAGEDAFGSRDMVSETVTDLTDRYVMQDKLGLELSCLSFPGFPQLPIWMRVVAGLPGSSTSSR